MSRPRPTVRARLTLIYTGLVAVCGGIVVAVSYILVSQLGVVQVPRSPAAAGVSAAYVAECKAAYAAGDKEFLGSSKCPASLLADLGAHAEQALTLQRLLQYSLLTLAVVIVLGAIVSWVLAGRALRPVKQITAAARAASEHNLSERVALSGPRDELQELADTFDAMLSRLEGAFEGQRQFIANASHELRTPLTVMRTTAEVVLANPESTLDDLRAMAVDIRAAVDHAEQLIGALFILARNDRGLTVRDPVDLATVVEDVLDAVAVAVGDRSVHVSLSPAVIAGDPVLVERLVANVVDNAIRYNLPAGDVWISTRTVGGLSRLVVENTGPIIEAADTQRIFLPFQRLSGRTTHDGYGLGLAIVASIATLHGGTVRAVPRGPGGGLSVTVDIPAAGGVRSSVTDGAGRTNRSSTSRLTRSGIGGG